ncbi:MAG TPA: hypothetical protein VFB46_01205 [Gemmatimonadaceae bacterium]|nr:hypothetical protein [Gemmatimonadaceae bacterium]
MLREVRQRLRERRGEYSLRRHVARLRREGRLPRIGAGVLFAVLVAGATFAQCDTTSITGPVEDVALSSAPVATVTSGSLAPEPERLEFKEKTVQRNVIFTGVNPCNGDAVRLEGTRYESIRISVGAGYFDSHHRIRDWCMRGYAIGNPEQKYTGRDEHEHHLKITTAGLDEEFETWESLKALGSEPDWKLRLYQRYKARYDDPLNVRVEFRSRASCEHNCTLPEGCVDREFTLVTADEFPISALPESP